LTHRTNNFVTNEEIRNIYIKNKNSDSKEWMNLVFEKTRFFIFKKIKKNFFYKRDLTQEAFLGLWTAIITFDFNKNFDFFRWADWHIKSKIRDQICKEKRQAHLLNSIKIYNLSTQNLECKQSKLEWVELKIDFFKWLNANEKCLSKRDSEIIVETIFLNKTLVEVAAAHGLSTERVRQIKEENFKKISNFVNK
jgi:RNA polymerase sigma factor (sigma-70 family)